ncbi:tmem9 [Halocaridina rubra]|uniref:Tmem9 n=1 Tax=Halocaridina rubra TaxID=373956 RepID=A0AAN8WXJ8_HALRR
MAKLWINFLLFVILSYFAGSVKAQYEDKRCICICPDPANVNSTKSTCKSYNKPVAPSKCDCENVVLTNPKIPADIKANGQEFCAQCDCKYESRNSTTIKVVVILVLWIISLLVVYMGFLLCLDPLLNKRRSQPSYQEHTNEEDEAGAIGGAPGMAQPLRVRPNVLGRVGHQQDKWKRQVQEQRRNIYDRHTMLN